MQITAVDAQEWTLDLRAPFVIAARTALHAHNVLIRIRADDAAGEGIGESAPVAYVTGETVTSVLGAVEQARETLLGRPIERLGPLLRDIAAATERAPAARAGMEMALLDLWAQRWRIPLWQYFGGCTERLTTDLTIPIVEPREAVDMARAAAAEGFRHFKVKVGDVQGTEADLARIMAVAGAAPTARLRIDANQAFDPDGAVRFIQALAAAGAAVDLIEQPVSKDDLAGLAFVKERSSFPIFADESARDPATVLQLLERDAVDGVNIKLMKSGFLGALEIISLCRAAGKRLMLGCMLESPLGISAAVHLAGGTGSFDFLDLDSHRLLAPLPGLAPGFDESGGEIRVHAASPGWNVGRLGRDT